MPECLLQFDFYNLIWHSCFILYPWTCTVMASVPAGIVYDVFRNPTSYTLHFALALSILTLTTLRTAMEEERWSKVYVWKCAHTQTETNAWGKQ